jgi:predicted O-methyltransferase YrrM
MGHPFNPLESKLLFAKPNRLHRASAWVEHVPFAMMLAELQRPGSIVELGTQWGVSYCAWCQAVVALGLNTKCYAVDTWAGDDHTGQYGDEVFEDLKRHHTPYERFSKLLRMTFDEALKHVDDGSVDLLHIDGLHTYEAVKHDYETWLPKMTDRGIILFHDTFVMDRGFGVYKLWSEVSSIFPHFNFEHGFGLGVLAVGKEQPEAMVDFLRGANQSPAATRELFSAFGRRLQWGLQELKIEELTAELDRLKGIEQSKDYRWGRKLVSPLRKVKRWLR